MGRSGGADLVRIMRGTKGAGQPPPLVSHMVSKPVSLDAARRDPKAGGMTRKVIHVAVNGVTGRMGYRQHLVRSLLAIREQGGVRLDDGTTVCPEPILVGRSEERLRAIAARHGLDRWTTDLDEVLADPSVDVYFDTQVTSGREASLMRAIEAGKHVYTEKPVAGSLAGALRLARAAQAQGITHGVVHDKLFLPGVIKLRRL